MKQPLPDQPRVIGIIQARMGSSRLPGKTLVDIAGRPFLAHVIQRAGASRRLHGMVVATTIEPGDDAIANFVGTQKAGLFRGSVQDVLDRFYNAALQAKADVVVRITADDPFKDPAVIDRAIERLLEDRHLDYVSNTLEPTFPEGLDIEVFRFDALARAWREATLPSEREHVTPFIWKQPALFHLENLRHSQDLSGMRWTLDYEDDLVFARQVYARLYRGQVFSMEDILELLRIEPSLSTLNAGHQRNSGYNQSIKQDHTQ